MLSKLIVSFVFTLLVLQQSVAALPTRGPIGQMQRRASKVARGRPTEPPFLKRRGPSQKMKRAAAPVQTQNIAYEKRAASIANYVAALGRRAAEDASIVAAMSATSTVNQAGPIFAVTSAPVPNNPKADLRKAASIGGDYSQWAEDAGVPSATATATSTWVSANVTLPSAVKRDARPTLALERRMVPHPGAPTGTIKINVIGGAQMSSFTLINATSTSEKIAPTTEAVKIGDSNITLPAKDALPTVTQTITFTAPSNTTQTATVTLVPTLLPSATASAYVVEDADNTTECTVPISAGSNGTVTMECGSSHVEVSVSVNASVTVDVNGSEKQEVKRNIAYFEAPISYSKETMLSEDWEDCIVGVDEGCLALPEY